MEIAGYRTDAILDQCVSAIQNQGRSVEECLTLYPDQALREELEPLLRLAERLQGGRSLEAPPSFRANAQQRLRSLADIQPRTRRSAPAFLPGLKSQASRPRWIPVLACLLLAALLVSGLGTAAASAQSLPGDFLYPLKIAQENVRLSLAPDAANQASLHLEFANQRIAEAMTLLKENRTSTLDQALADYNNQLQTELAFLGQESSLTLAEQSSLANKLLLDVASHETNLAALSQLAPQSAQGNIAAALTTTQKAHTQAAQVIRSNNQTGGSSPSPTQTPEPTPTPAPGSKTSLPDPLPVVMKPTHTLLASPGSSLHGTPFPTHLPPAPPQPDKTSTRSVETRTPWPTPPTSIFPTFRPTRPTAMATPPPRAVPTLPPPPTQPGYPPPKSVIP